MQIERTDIFIASLGFEAYRVGGSVRDEILGRKAHDADYMIRGVSLFDLGKALVSAGKKISPLSDRQGQQFGWRANGIEIAVPRIEANSGDGRKQIIVAKPDASLVEDARRRDFTFNALYKLVGPVAGSVVDPTSTGLYDLQHKLVRTTHPDSFRDDPLRTLRALRFVSLLGHDLSADTREQMERYAGAVTGLSAKGYASGTVMQELSKLLMGDDVAKALRLARDTGVLATLIPELAPMLGFDQGSRYHDMTTDEHTFKALETAAHVDAPLRVRWALLFHDSGKPQTAWVGDDGRKHYYARDGKQQPLVDPGDGRSYNLDHEVMGELIWRAAANRLGTTRELREEVATLIREHMVPVQTKNPGTRVRRMRVRFGDTMTRDLLLHRVCDLSGKGVKVALNQIEHVAKLERLRGEAAKAGTPASVRDLAIDGNDLKAMGVTGRDIGRVLARVLDEVICAPTSDKMHRDWQLRRAEALR